jgi:hypothetical protein
MGFTHVTVANIEGDDPKIKWHTTETYKISDDKAKELAAMKDKPTGYDLTSWLKDNGGVLDDDNGKAARVSVKNDGTTIADHYKDDKITGTDPIVHPKGAKNDTSGAQLLLALMTGGTSLLITPFTEAGRESEGSGSKFTDTKPAATQPDEQPTTTGAKQTKKATTAPAVKR